MRVTIIPSDGFVSVNNNGYSDIDLSSIDPSIHAVQWNNTEGWIEFVNNLDGTKPANEFINSIELFQPALDAWQVVYDKAHEPQPDPKPPTAQENKNMASRLLFETDYTQLSDVNLINKEEFTSYRSILREIIANPLAGDLVWPVKPIAIWA